MNVVDESLWRLIDLHRHCRNREGIDRALQAEE
jgi:hypothetical protein